MNMTRNQALFTHFITSTLRKIRFEEGFSQLAFTCSKLIIGTLERGVKYVQSYQ